MTDVIFSVSLSSIGRRTHPAGTAAAHMRYIMRAGASEDIVARGVPRDAMSAAAWIDAQERGDRINARVCDKLLLALPHQLSREQRRALVQAYCNDVSSGVPYVAALHHPSCDGDQRNWHAHIVFRDRDPMTGKRVMQTSERGVVELFRERAEYHINAALLAAGVSGHTDRRSHAARGLNRTPGLHVGPAATNAARREARGNTTPAGRASNAAPLRSQVRRVRNGVGARSVERVVDYLLIDGGTRLEENARRAAVNARIARAEEQAILNARLSAARAGMATLGLGTMPPLQISRPESMQPRAIAAARVLAMDTMPLLHSAWAEAEAIARAHRRIASAWVRSKSTTDLVPAAKATELGHKALAAAEAPRPMVDDAVAPLARQIRVDGIAAARLRHATGVARDRLAAAEVSRPIIDDAVASLAREIRADGIGAARLRHATGVARDRLADAKVSRPTIADAVASLAREIRADGIGAARLRHATGVARDRLADAKVSRPTIADAVASLAREIRADGIGAARLRHATGVARDRLAAAGAPSPMVDDAVASLARQIRVDGIAAARLRHATGVARDRLVAAGAPSPMDDAVAPLARQIRADSVGKVRRDYVAVEVDVVPPTVQAASHPANRATQAPPVAPRAVLWDYDPERVKIALRAGPTTETVTLQDGPTSAATSAYKIIKDQGIFGAAFIGSKLQISVQQFVDDLVHLSTEVAERLLTLLRQAVDETRALSKPTPARRVPPVERGRGRGD